jgi:hypothetical protein
LPDSAPAFAKSPLIRFAFPPSVSWYSPVVKEPHEPSNKVSHRRLVCNSDYLPGNAYCVVNLS